MPPNKNKLIDDCFKHDRDRLKHDEALSLLKERIAPIVSDETLPLSKASGKIIAEAIVSPVAIPAADNSAVDGYAFRHADYATTGGFFEVGDRIPAGDLTPRNLSKSAASRIFTGAMVPTGADTIVMQEDCETHQQGGRPFVVIPPGLKVGANLRKAGEDLKIGDPVAAPGDRLSPQLLAAIASTGKPDVKVCRPLNIALLSSGNELIRPGNPLRPGQVYDANHFLLRSFLETLPVTVTDLGIVKDRFDVVMETIIKAAQSHDVIVSSGGASKGEEDHIVNAIQALGKRHLWQLAVKPGRPMSFGQIDQTLFFGLPGNPVACFICFCLYARPALLRLAGSHWHEPVRFRIRSGFEVKSKKPDRREFWRGILRFDEEGSPFLEKFTRDGSGLITGLRTADGLIEIPEPVTTIKKGDPLAFIPWSEFGIKP